MLKRAFGHAGVIALVAAAPMLLGATAGDPADRCQARQLAAAGKLCRAVHECVADRVRDGRSAKSAQRCQDDALDRFRSRLAKYRKRARSAGGTCNLLSTKPLSNPLVDEASDIASGVIAAIDTKKKGGKKLAGEIFDAAGGHCRSILNEEKRQAKRPDDMARSEKRTAARAELAAVVEAASDRAEQKRGIVYLGPSADAIADAHERLADTISDRTGTFVIGGTIRSADASFVDGDVNDGRTRFGFNDTFASARALPVPSAVGGYVTLPGRGPPGPRRSLGDLFDVYAFQLLEGQEIALYLGGDPRRVDLDICLYDESTAQVDCSLGTEAIETLTVPTDGDYFVAVFPYENCFCGSNYLLTAGEPVPLRSNGIMRLSDDFSAGEAVVRTRRSGKSISRATRSPWTRKRGDSSREMLLELAPGEAAPLAAVRDDGEGPRSVFAEAGSDPELWARLQTIREIKELRRDPDIEFAEPNYRVHSLLVPNDPFVGLQWHYSLINLPQAWEVTTGSEDVVVAVIDTGVLLDHPDLKGKLLPGFDFISSKKSAGDGERLGQNGDIDANPDDPGDGLGGAASSFHGTHVAGTIGGATDDGVGLAGVGWNTRIMPLRVLGRRGGSTYDIVQAIRFAAALPNDSGTVPEAPADVINLSLGGAGASASLEQAVRDARAQGVLVFAAAGNEGSNQPNFPAAFEEVVSVSAVGPTKELAPYSNFGPTIDVAAPGGDMSRDLDGDTFRDGVLSSAGDDTSGEIAFSYLFYEGTSMASPHVAGVAALMRAIAPDLSPERFDALLAAGSLTEDLGPPGRDNRFGAGLIDARAAVSAALAEAGQPPPPDLPNIVATPGALNFGGLLRESVLEISNRSGGSVEITDVSQTQGADAWLAVEPLETDQAGLGTYRVVVDRSQQASGTLSASIIIESTENTIEVAVQASVGVSSVSDTGFHFVLLVDAKTFDTVREIGVAPVAGTYQYRFEGVPFGDYLITAGSDFDNDGILCGGGEACGQYPTVQLHQPVRIDSDRGDLDFGTGFQQVLRIGSSRTAPSEEFAPFVREID